MSYRIAICDDEKSTCSKLENILLTYSSNTSIKFKIDIYYTASALNEALVQGSIYDILFLDIQLEKNTSGIETGKLIRDKLHNDNLVIIYISSYENYAMQLFQTRPFDFIIKPFNSEKITNVLNKVNNILDASDYYFEYYINQTLYRIKYSDIIFFRSCKRKIIIETITGHSKTDHEFYGHLSEVEQQLPKNQFIRVHKSYIVNYNHIKEYNYTCITTSKNTIINISRAYQNRVRDAVMNK